MADKDEDHSNPDLAPPREPNIDGSTSNVSKLVISNSGTSVDATNADTYVSENTKTYLMFSQDLSQEINNLEAGNPFASLLDKSFLKNDAISSDSADNLTVAHKDGPLPQRPALKRPRQNSDPVVIKSSDLITFTQDFNKKPDKTIPHQSIPIPEQTKETERTKKVSFSFQQPQEKQPWSLSSDEEDLIHQDNPIWNYNIDPQAFESWKVSLNAMRNQAKLQIRVHYLRDMLKNNNLPAWSYGLATCPEFVNPLPMNTIKGSHDRAAFICEQSLEDLSAQMKVEKRKADKFLQATKELYEEVGNRDFSKAEQRLVAIITQARKREHELHRKPPTIALPEDKDDPEWASLLARRRFVAKRDRSRSRSGSPDRKPPSPRPNYNRGGFNNRRQGCPGTRGNNSNRRGRGRRGNYNYQPTPRNYNYDYNYAPNYDRGGKRPNNSSKYEPVVVNNDEERVFLEGFRAAKASRKN